MIHLIAGQSALQTLQKTNVPGEKFSIDDILMEGPAVDGLQSNSSWDMRADWLEQHFSIAKIDYLSGKQERHRILEDSQRHDEIVLWFEFDLYCQANLLYYLDWYAKNLRAARLSLVCPETVAGRQRFRGLGELYGAELAALFPTREEVTDAQKRVAQDAWQAFSSPNPEGIQKLIDDGTPELPLIAPAFRAHLERFPSTTNGMGILGQKTLEILNHEPLPFHKLFTQVAGSPELFRHGMGDLQFQTYLKIWSNAPHPLVIEEEAVRITDTGRDILLGHADNIALNGIDHWYGGAHLLPSQLWRWSPERQRLQPRLS
jgi:hypothetical protein